MSIIESTSREIRHLEELSLLDTPVHRFDPRVKVLTTLIYIGLVISFDKYNIRSLIPYIFYPVFLASAGNIPFRLILGRVIIALPFALFIGIFNPLFDRTTMMQLWGVPVSGGVVSLVSLLFRFLLTVSTAVILIAVTGFNTICGALAKMRVPRVLVVQLMFLYRYLFVLIDDFIRIHRAWKIRSFDNNRLTIKIYRQLVGQVLLRTINRAERIFTAMKCRGFTGEIHIMQESPLQIRDIVFTVVWITLFIVFRIYDITMLIGLITTRIGA